ncbi:hypothetical protein J2858_002121 [Neorhizobium galegae]|uniref:DUF982 domain-containing protein n=1 Tax=Neorhizobium galegae TaxID=399 RepID=UPI001AEB1016|nr:DUF982 domain-containing protein [Neorhizobium galegae]MBP2549198.1 hypothetical protein [Neorhizobium galegae]
MARTHWQQPVTIGRDVIAGPHEAIRFMDRHWPPIKGMCFARAHLSCLAALDGRETAEDARLRFEAAVSEAKLH